MAGQQRPLYHLAATSAATPLAPLAATPAFPEAFAAAPPAAAVAAHAHPALGTPYLLPAAEMSVQENEAGCEDGRLQGKRKDLGCSLRDIKWVPDDERQHFKEVGLLGSTTH